MTGKGSGSYPRKYWWLVLVVVPLVAVLIQYQPWKRASSQSAPGTSVSGNQFLGSSIIGNVSLVVNEAEKAGAVLDPALLESLKSAIGLSRSGNHDAAVAKMEAVRAASSTVGQLPSILNSLGVEYLLAGRVDQARTAFEEVLQKDPHNKTAWAGLGQLPDTRLVPLQVVNFSSEWGYKDAGKIVDQDPNSSWKSADGLLPQSFVIELPIHAALSEVVFNNAARANAKQATREIEISFSDQSATSGFESIVKATLVQGEIGQGVKIKPVKDSRWVKLRILTNYGDPENTQLGDVSVIGKPRPR
jgi:tetratricopeptide (TPR) repeat protein